ncbi:hypothetical protein HD554DRAFT_5528 [Boletus coccyginus]|nr:hypothetical protein HD554DRAFT_5528 [Boletus coccyginus]
MSLFKWSTPERREADRILPIIPNEIYLCIFEHVAPPTSCLTSEQLGMVANLSRVCRFFANLCLPRLFEFLEFSGAVGREDPPTQSQWHRDATYRTLRATTLCTQIDAKQPLALALARRVKTCHFTNWKPYSRESGYKLSANFKYLATMLHSGLRHIRELGFFDGIVGPEHWDAVAALPSLEELAFISCYFYQHHADRELEKRVRARVKLSCLWVVGHHMDSCGPLAAIDTRHLRTLSTDTQLLKRARPTPQSLEALTLRVYIYDSLLGLDHFRSTLDELVWKKLPLLKWLTLRTHYPSGNLIEVLSLALEGVGSHKHLQSFALKSFGSISEISFAEVRRFLDYRLGPSSRLKYVNVQGKVFRLVDGGWSENGPTECSPSDKYLRF